MIKILWSIFEQEGNNFVFSKILPKTDRVANTQVTTTPWGHTFDYDIATSQPREDKHPSHTLDIFN